LKLVSGEFSSDESTSPSTGFDVSESLVTESIDFLIIFVTQNGYFVLVGMFKWVFVSKDIGISVGFSSRNNIEHFGNGEGVLFFSHG